MKSIFKWFGFLFLIIFLGLLMYQNHGVLLETKSLNLFSEEVFGFSYGAVEIPLAVYFAICVIFGAILMTTPAAALWIKSKRLIRRIRIMEKEMLEEASITAEMDPGDDLAYHIKDDQNEK